MRHPVPPLAAALAALALAGAAFAQTPPSRDPDSVKPGVYAVEPAHTRVLFAVSHLDFTTYYGQFTGVSGTLQIDPAAPAASHVSITIPAASITTTNTVLDAELKSEAWLDAAKYPTITFTSTKVEPTGKGEAKITGDLTLHGVTRSVVLNARFNAAGVNPLDHKFTAGFDADTRINRSDFGVKQYLPMIGDKLDVTISAAFEKAD
jgi:polyisoprenoid-binding protein YceI